MASPKRAVAESKDYDEVAVSQSSVAVMSRQPRTLLAAATACMGAVVFGCEIGYWSQINGTKGFNKVITGDMNVPPTSDELSWLSSITFLVGALFALPFVTDIFANGIGRRWTIIVAGLVFAVSQTLQAAAQGPGMMWAGRALVGVAVAFCVTTVPMYLSEIAPKEARGLLGGLFQFTLCFFLFVAGLIGYLLDHYNPESENTFRYAIWYQVPVGLVTSIMMFFNCESPRFLLLKGKDEEAFEVLKKLRKGSGSAAAIQREYELMKEDIAMEKADGEATYKGLCRGYPLRIMIVAMLMQFLQQFSGMNAFNMFAPMIYRAAGQDDPALWGVIGNIVQFVATVPSFLLVDRAGRRVFLIGGAIVVIIIWFTLAILGVAVFERSDECYVVNNCPAGFTCPEDAVYTSLSNLQQGVCGTNSTCLSEVTGAESSTMLLECMYTGDGAPTVENPYAIVNSGVGWVLVIFTLLLNFIFGLTWGPIGWTYNAEIAPLKYRSKILGMAAFSNLFNNWLVVYIAPYMLRAMQFPSFFIFAGVFVFALLFAIWIPETAGVPLERITAKWETKLGVKYTENSSPDAEESDEPKPNQS